MCCYNTSVLYSYGEFGDLWGFSVPCRALEEENLTVTAMEKGERQEHLVWYLLGAAWTKCLTTSAC